MLKEPDAVIEMREIKRRLSAEAGNDMYKLGEIARKRAQELGVVYSKRKPINSPGIDRMLADFRLKKAARREKIDAYLARRAARTVHAKSA